MKFTYPAIIRKTENGYHADFPDLECCEADGGDFEDVMEKANEALYNWIELELQEDDGQLPAISDHQDVELLEGDVIRNICVNIRFTDGWDE
jgi:predicted RNase H-like HicB family nuclease